MTKYVLNVYYVYIYYMYTNGASLKNWSKHAVPGSASVGIPFNYSNCTSLWGFHCEYSLKIHHVDDTPKIHRGALQLKRRIPGTIPLLSMVYIAFFKKSCWQAF